MREVWVISESLWRSYRLGLCSFWGFDERMIEVSEMCAALDLRLGAGAFIVRGI